MAEPSSQRSPSKRAVAGAVAVRVAPGVAIALALVLPWLLDAAGHGLPRRLAQAMVSVGLAGLVAGVGRAALGRLRREGRATAWALAGLTGAAFAVHFAGLAFEVGHGYYRDEGIYRAAAERINGGALLPTSFIYGHLPYYLAAWSLWLHALFLAPTTWMVRVLTGLADEAAVSWMWIRVWSGLAGALTVLPVFGAARTLVDGLREPDAPPRAAGDGRLGLWAGLLAGGAITASTLYNEVTHVFISDVPSAFFAALCLYFVARLAVRETPRDYLWAGVASGLAAGCKYPAGVVAAAIVVVWAVWRLRTRRFAWGLGLAGAASLGAFLLVMPSFFAHAGSAFAGQGKDVLFGLRQYGDAGWIGVEKDSNAVWYGGQLLQTFGLGALLLGLVGVAGLPRPARARWAIVAAFPFLFGGLLVAMSMVVKRNLLPLLPGAAVLLGAGGAGAIAWLERRPWARRAAAPAVALAMLAAPAIAVVAQDLSLSRPGTREVAVAWIREHLPPGTGIVKESYTPNLGGEYDVLQARFAARVEPADLWSGRYDFVLLADSAYGRFLDPENLRLEHHRIYAERYRELLALPEVFAIEGGATRLGPGFSLRRLERPGTAAVREAVLSAKAAMPSRDGMRPAGAASLVFGDGDAALFKSRLAAGSYGVALDGDALAGGAVRLVSDEVRELGTCATDAACTFALAAPAKVFLRVTLPAGAVLRGVRITPVTP